MLEHPVGELAGCVYFKQWGSDVCHCLIAMKSVPVLASARSVTSNGGDKPKVAQTATCKHSFRKKPRMYSDWLWKDPDKEIEDLGDGDIAHTNQQS